MKSNNLKTMKTTKNPIDSTVESLIALLNAKGIINKFVSGANDGTDDMVDIPNNHYHIQIAPYAEKCLLLCEEEREDDKLVAISYPFSSNNPKEIVNFLMEAFGLLAPVEKIKKDEFVRKPGTKRVYRKIGWCKTNRAYELGAWDDISHFIYVKKGTMLEVGFDF